MSQTLVEVAIDALATYRLTRLVMDDEITVELREKAYEQLERLPEPLKSKAMYLLTCPWCVSVWAAGTLLLLRRVAPDLANYINTLLAASAATGIAYERL